MHYKTLAFLILLAAPMFSQENSSEKIMDELRLKIESTRQNERLKWMDSLSNYIAYETGFESDSVLKETVKLALELDSVDLAIKQTANLIYFQNNIVGSPEVGQEIFKEFLPKAENSANYRALYKYYIEGGDSFFFMGDHENAIQFYNKGEIAATKAEYERGIGIAKLYKGGSLSFSGKFSESSKVLQEASRIFQQTKDTFNIISAKNSLSILYSQNAFYKEAKVERDEAIAMAKKIKSYAHLVSFYYNAATDARKMGRPMDEISNLKLSIRANDSTRSKDVNIPNLYANLIIAYSRQDSIPKAKELLRELENEPDKYIVGANRERYVDALKYIEFHEGRYTSALRYGKEHLKLNSAGTHLEEIQRAEKFLYQVYEKLGDNQNAFVHFKNYTRINDSISNVQKVKALSFYQTLYETEKRDAMIANQQKDIALLDAKNEIQNQWMLFGGIGLLGLFGSIILVRSRNAARRRHRMTEGFSQDLIQAQEEERTRVARELHDSVGQKLMLLTKKTKEKDDPDMEQLANGTLGELRSIARGLHPATMEKLGLTAALESMINEVDANTSIFFTHEITNVDAMLSKDASLHLYRIVQEVLNNMVKHSEAKSASITIEKGVDRIEAVIKDNGKGFSFPEKLNSEASLGMKTLLERAKILKSQLTIDSEPNKGTSILLHIPT